MPSVTFSKTILPIPESVVVGSGSYTVPANKYGYFSGSARSTVAIVSYNATTSGGTSAVGCEQWLAAGSSISVSTTAPNGSFGAASGSGWSSFSASAYIQIGGVSVVGSVSRGYNFWQTQSNFYASDASVGWSVALFPIPIDNLPTALTT